MAEEMKTERASRVSIRRLLPWGAVAVILLGLVVVIRFADEAVVSGSQSGEWALFPLYEGTTATYVIRWRDGYKSCTVSTWTADNWEESTLLYFRVSPGYWYGNAAEDYAYRKDRASDMYGDLVKDADPFWLRKRELEKMFPSGYDFGWLPAGASTYALAACVSYVQTGQERMDGPLRKGVISVAYDAFSFSCGGEHLRLKLLRSVHPCLFDYSTPPVFNYLDDDDDCGKWVLPSRLVMGTAWKLDRRKFVCADKRFLSLGDTKLECRVVKVQGTSDEFAVARNMGVVWWSHGDVEGWLDELCIPSRKYYWRKRRALNEEAVKKSQSIADAAAQRRYTIPPISGTYWAQANVGSVSGDLGPLTERAICYERGIVADSDWSRFKELAGKTLDELLPECEQLPTWRDMYLPDKLTPNLCASILVGESSEANQQNQTVFREWFVSPSFAEPSRFRIPVRDSDRTGDKVNAAERLPIPQFLSVGLKWRAKASLELRTVVSEKRVLFRSVCVDTFLVRRSRVSYDLYAPGIGRMTRGMVHGGQLHQMVRFYIPGTGGVCVLWPDFYEFPFQMCDFKEILRQHGVTDDAPDPEP